MSIFGNAHKVGIKDEALNTKNWISDEELEKIFFPDDNDGVINDINSLVQSNTPQTDDLISVKTNASYNMIKAKKLRVV